LLSGREAKYNWITSIKSSFHCAHHQELQEHVELYLHAPYVNEDKERVRVRPTIPPGILLSTFLSLHVEYKYLLNIFLLYTLNVLS
jgi:hypothetical protein